MTKTYILYPIIYTDWSAEMWKASHFYQCQIVKDPFKAWKIDGITLVHKAKWIFTRTANYDIKFL